MDQNEGPLTLEHTQQASKAALGLIFYSFLMFTLPFLAFFGVQRILHNYFDIDGFINIGWSVLAVVITENAIIIAYAYKAHHEAEYDDECSQSWLNFILLDDGINRTDSLKYCIM